MTRRKGIRIEVLGVVCLLLLGAAVAFGGEAPAPDQTNPLGSLLGPGSTLQADGEFTMEQGDAGEVDTFHAVDNVLLNTKDFDLTCDELDYSKPTGKMLATAGTKGRVHITMRGGVSPTGASGQGGSTRATCGRYEYFLEAKRHILTQDPVIYQRDKDNKEMMIKGKTVEFSQMKNGQWKMIVKGGGWMGDPNAEKQRVLEKKGIASKPTVNLDTVAPKPPEPAKTVPTKSAKIDEGNVDKLLQPKPPRVIRLEEGG